MRIIRHAAATNGQRLHILPVLTPYGSIPLGQVAEVEMGTGPQTNIRENQVRTAYVQGQIWERDIGSVMRDVQQQLENVDLPLGFSLEYGGELSDIIEYLSVPAFIGVIMLSGIVVNNGIVLVDYINILRREQGYSRDDAIRKAGPVRLRPILMTTMTTILGMLPLAMGLGEGSEVQAPMAIVIIGGLAVSTIITLIFVPIIYTLLNDLGLWVKRKVNSVSRSGSIS